MTRPAKPRPQRLILWCIVALAVALILLRLFVFVHHVRSGHRRYVAAVPLTMRTSAAHRFGDAAEWTDSYGDGTPEFLRLRDPADQAAFRRWFTLIADYQAIRPKSEAPPEITDCASLLRYAYREALKRHDGAWFRDTGMEVAALPGEIRAWRYPETPLGAGLFRVEPGPFEPGDATDGTFAQFADAKRWWSAMPTL